jgi:hypothetical protein
MTVPRNHPIPAAILRGREKWLKAIEAGDIKAALISDGRAYPPNFGSPELKEADLDFEMAEQLDEAAPDLYAKQKRERMDSASEAPEIPTDYRTWLGMPS